MSHSSFNSNEVIKSVGRTLAWGIVIAAPFLWIHQETTGWVALWSRRVVVAVVIISVLNVATCVLPAYLQQRRRLKSERDARIKAEAAVRDSRRALREDMREFSLFLEDQYSWILEMDELEQERRALLWYDDITSTWAKENERFHKLRADDDCAIVDEEVGVDLVERMLAIWDRRSWLYQYAIAWSNPVERAREILRIGRLIRQIQVEEAQEQERFAGTIQKQLGEETAATENEYEDTPGSDWGPRPVSDDDADETLPNSLRQAQSSRETGQ